MPDIRISTVGLAGPLFNIPGGTDGFVNGQTSPPPAVALPAKNGYRFQQGGGTIADFSFDVTPEGRVRYDEAKFGAFLEGNGTDTLHVVGFPIEVDSIALSHGLLLRLGGTSFLAPGRHPLRLPPARNYGFQPGGGILADLSFGVGLDGTITLEERFSRTASIKGGTLVVTGHRITIDGRRLSHDVLPLGLSGVATFLDRSTTHDFTVVPAQGYGFQPGAGVLSDLRYGVNLDGTIVLDDRFSRTASVTGGTTLVIGGHPITVDGTQLSHALIPISMARATPAVLEASTSHPLVLLPARGYRFQPGPGVVGDLAFGVGLDGTILLDPRFSSFARVTTGPPPTLVIAGHEITIDGTGLSHNLFPVSLTRPRPAVLERTAPQTLRLLPGKGHLLAAASGVPADMSYDVTVDGKIDYPPTCDTFLTGRGSAILGVRGYPLIVDGHHADSELVGFANVPVRAKGNEVLAVLVPGDGYLPQTRKGVFKTPFGLERNADITFDPAFEGRYVVRRASAPNPSRPGEEVTITVAVNAAPPAVGTPTGEVTFTEGGSRLGAASLDAQGRALFRISTLPAGEHEIVVAYQGDHNFSGSSARLRHRVE